MHGNELRDVDGSLSHFLRVLACGSRHQFNRKDKSLSRSQWAGKLVISSRDFGS